MKQPTSGFRAAVTSLSALHAAVFGWAASTLPWRDWTLFGAAAGVVAMGYIALACVAGFGHSALAKVWRTQSFIALAWSLAVGLWLLRSAWRVASLYGGIGEGVAAALVTIYAATLLFTAPFSFWGIGWTGGVRLTRGTIVASITIVAFSVGWLAYERSAVVGEPLLSAAETSKVARSLRSLRAEPLAFGSQSLFSQEPAQCVHDFREGLVSVLVTFRHSLGTGPNTVVTSRCVQSDAQSVTDKIQALLDKLDAQGRVKIDIVHSARALDTENLFETLMVRPGIDGLCWSKRCFSPWQMVATSAFVRHMPFPAVPDARMGVSFPKLQFLLTGNEAPPKRIDTVSILLDGATAHDLSRVPNRNASLTRQALERSVSQANRYIRGALREDGTFNYLVDPYSGEVTMGSLSIPRQAGTTLVLCELGDSPSTAPATRALDAIAKYERPITVDAAPLGASVLSVDAPSDERAVRLGSSALSLVAFLRCRDKVGNRHDGLAARLANALLKAQRPDGGFWHSLDAHGQPGAERSLYIDGQIMFALVLLEGTEGIADVDRVAVKDALERAYSYFAHAYWPAMLGDFFYLEENWHCLAARAALSVHRHDGYERFCIDYARMKARLLLREGEHPDFEGAFGFGNVVPPHNTATAGFAEATAAALAVAKRRRDPGDVSALRDALKQSLTFLLRNQLGGLSCFACTDQPSVEGAFSEHMASPAIRIDYVQHAMAALGHGGRELGLLGES